LQAPRHLVHDQAFNVGRSHENYQVQDIVRMVAEAISGTTVKFSADAGPDLRCYRVSCCRIENSISGYEPQWTVKAGIEQLRDAYLHNGLTRDDFLGPKYLRIAQIQLLQAKGVVDDELRWVSSQPPRPEGVHPSRLLI
jgi:hypothetical protein